MLNEDSKKNILDILVNKKDISDFVVPSWVVLNNMDGQYPSAHPPVQVARKYVFMIF